MLPFYVLCIYLFTIQMSHQFYRNMTLAELDNKLVEMLSNPSCDEGDMVLNASLHYMNQLEDMNVQCIREDPRQSLFTWMQSSLVKGIDKVQAYVNSGEPKFVHIKLKPRVFRDTYNWTDNEFIKLETYCLGIKILWRKFQEYLHEHNNKY